MTNHKSSFYQVLTILFILSLYLPAYAGIAEKYLGDEGIENDPDVLFAENFEEGTVDEICKRWDTFKNKDGKVMAVSDDIPAGSAGSRSLQMTGTLGENAGGDLYTRFPSQDKAYLRFYTKFAADHAYEHHFVGFGGYNPPSAWPDPRAGTRPNGDDRFHVMIDPIGGHGKYPPPGIWSLYTYWPEMKISADGNYWGNCLNPVEPVIVTRDKWICVELMIKMNSAPDKADGELTLWIDGEQVAHFVKGVKRGLWSGMGFDLIEDEYDTKRWFELTDKFKDEPEKGRRCDVCYAMRLERTAQKAAEEGFDVFTTVMSLSPWKKADVLNRIGRQFGARFGVGFIEADFKKKDGFRKSIELGRELGLYRQDYCGCTYSLTAHERRKRGPGI